MVDSMELRILEDDLEVLKVDWPSMLVFTVRRLAFSKYPGLLPAKTQSNERIKETRVKTIGTMAMGRILTTMLTLTCREMKDKQRE